MADLFEVRPREVFYGRQIEVLFERRFFHWITTRALGELASEGAIQFVRTPRAPKEVKFYWSRRNRYWRRQVASALMLIQEYSREEWTRALGRHAEIMFTAALAGGGFVPTAENVREYKGAEW